MSKRRVLFTATLVKGHIAKFHTPYLRWFKEQGWETWVAAKNDYPDGKCEIPFCDYFVNIDFARSPFSPQTKIAYKQLKDLLDHERFDLIHTHTPVGSALTRLAAKKARKNGTKVIYTAHGFHFYKGGPAINWVMWFPVEKLFSRLCDCIITINKEDYDIALKFAKCTVRYAPGTGVDLSRFLNQRLVDGCELVVRNSVRTDAFSASEQDCCILMIGDVNKNKNHMTVIKALEGLPESFRLAIAGEGELTDELRRYSTERNLEKRVCLLGFRDDIVQLLNACDIFCLPSYREGLPIALIEAMATSVPCVASDVRGSRDLLVDTDCPLVDPSDTNAFADAFMRLSEDRSYYDSVSRQVVLRAMEYSLSECLTCYASIYRDVVGFDEF